MVYLIDGLLGVCLDISIVPSKLFQVPFWHVFSDIWLQIVNVVINIYVLKMCACYFDCLTPVVIHRIALFLYSQQVG